jgi:hypothetical protein
VGVRLGLPSPFSATPRSHRGPFVSEDMSEENARGFKGVWIPRSLWEAKDLNWTQKCLLAEIDSLCSEESGPCHASVAYLAERMGIAEGSIKNLLSELTKKKYLFQLGSDGRQVWRCVSPKVSSNPGQYESWIDDPRCHQTVTREVINSLPQTSQIDEPVYRRDTRRDTSREIPPIVPHGGTAVSFSENGAKPKKQKLTAQSAIKLVSIDLTLQSLTFLPVWQAWIEHRFSHPKGPPTIGAVREHMRICAQLGEARAIAAIRHSIACSYLSIFEPQHRPNGNKTLSKDSPLGSCL